MSETLSATDRLWVALDYEDIDAAQPVIDGVAEQVGAFKVGTEIAARNGWYEPIHRIHERNGNVFADTKLHDIPATVGKTARAVMECGAPAFINMHTTSGSESMEAMVETIAEYDKRTKVLGVTALTSLSREEILDIYNEPFHTEFVRKMGHKALESGLDGLICSPQELETIRDDTALDNLLLATPGVRPKWAAKNDQTRITTPRQAIEMGGDYVIVGRPITQSPLEGGPQEAADRIVEELKET